MIRKHVVVGSNATLPPGPVDLFVLPGDGRAAMPPNVRAFYPATIDDALIMLREAYADHEAIATLGSTVVIGDPEEWRGAIEARLATFIDDLGNSAVDSWIGARNALHNRHSLATRPWNQDIAGMFEAIDPTTAAVCIASGPSASQYLPEIAKLRAGLVIFCADSMLSGCLDAGIDPDFVTFAERGNEVVAYSQRGRDSKATIIAAPVIDPRIVSAFGGRVIWWNGGDDLSLFMAPATKRAFGGRSAGTLCIAAALATGIERVFLVGHDLSYGPSGASHATEAHPVAADSQAKEDARGTVIHLMAKGNSGHDVDTNTWWNAFRVDIEYMIADRRAYVVNVNEYGGAAIAGTIHGQLPQMRGERSPYAIHRSAGYSVETPSIEAIREDCYTISRCAGIIADDIASKKTDPSAAARMLTVGSLVPPGNAWLFRYVFRSVYHSLLMRMHLGGDHATTTRLLALTLQSMTRRMLLELDSI